MAAAEKRGPDAATLDLWRVAEKGDVEELASVLPRVPDINARNEYGVTALMRAAQFGHVRMVRALLEQGADANIIRNDKFTALALAAFFGHTQVVRVLMEHGADSQAPTRHGTSPHMWATARTFNEVVDQLERPAPPTKATPPTRSEPIAPAAPAAAPTPAPAIRVAAAGPVAGAMVRTLKDPPEIWDLVHEAPKGFDARSAFKERLREAGLTFRLAMVAILIGAGVVSVLVFRGVDARGERNTELQREAAPAVEATSNVQAPEAVTTNAPVASSPDVEVTPVDTTSNVDATSSKAGDSRVVVSPRSSRRPRVSSRRLEPISELPVAVEAKADQPAPTVNDKPKPSRVESPGPALSPQLITPGKNAAAKGKVIQWP